MKRLFFSFLISIGFGISCKGQGLFLNEMVNDSIKILESNCISYNKFTDTHIWNYGIRGYYNILQEKINYILIININSSYRINTKNNAKLLIKTFSGDIIELTAYSQIFDKRVLGYQTITNTFGSKVIENIIALNISEYYINENDLEKLQNGISKIRLEIYNGFLEYSYNKDRVGKQLYDVYKLIDIKKSEELIEEESSFYKNF